ncbi:hypothetical protein DACRYDRAFT_16021 [Dacryopinax primogenitus]|uniref:Uncharacterized protein n=1 Tax=Dacryopinax primogenitus (strain DJM 731) TaxID=1858805 RepID=M5FU81_DACPD|nr:uncharacterized protein DACRYDRAFT_16021 [Dacryopinax primogenitus]EJU01261.1 hypothetical protein DACRYDRAFT_16021 [Dacryopinax primogenitus]
MLPKGASTGIGKVFIITALTQQLMGDHPFLLNCWWTHQLLLTHEHLLIHTMQMLVQLPHGSAPCLKYGAVQGANPWHNVNATKVWALTEWEKMCQELWDKGLNPSIITDSVVPFEAKAKNCQCTSKQVNPHHCKTAKQWEAARHEALEQVQAQRMTDREWHKQELEEDSSPINMALPFAEFVAK